MLKTFTYTHSSSNVYICVTLNYDQQSTWITSIKYNLIYYIDQFIRYIVMHTVQFYNEAYLYKGHKSHINGYEVQVQKSILYLNHLLCVFI